MSVSGQDSEWEGISRNTKERKETWAGRENTRARQGSEKIRERGSQHQESEGKKQGNEKGAPEASKEGCKAENGRREGRKYTQWAGRREHPEKTGRGRCRGKGTVDTKDTRDKDKTLKET